MSVIKNQLIIVILSVFLTTLRAPGSDMGIFVGASSNPAQDPNGPSGSFFQITPKWERSFEKSEGHLLNVLINADLKKFNDDEVAQCSDSNLFRGGFSLINRAFQNWELELAWGLEYLSGRIAPTDFTTRFGEPNVYLSQSLNLSATFGAKPVTFTFGSKLAWQDYTTNVFDEQNNAFQDDNSGLGLYTKWLFAISQKLNFEIGADWNEKKYSYRKVRGEYGMSQLTGENLHLMGQDYYVAWIPEVYAFKSTTVFAYGHDHDLVSGMSDVRKERFEQKFLFPLSGRQGLSLKSDLSILARQFTFIHADLSSLEAAKNSGLRRDTVSKLSVGLVKSFWTDAEGVITLAYLSNASNFGAEIYSDRTIETGLTAKF